MAMISNTFTIIVKYHVYTKYLWGASFWFQLIESEDIGVLSRIRSKLIAKFASHFVGWSETNYLSSTF
jgi:hypothetical protein